MNPPINEDPLDEINDRIKSNLRTQRLLTEALKEPKGKALLRDKKTKANTKLAEKYHPNTYDDILPNESDKYRNRKATNEVEIEINDAFVAGDITLNDSSDASQQKLQTSSHLDSKAELESNVGTIPESDDDLEMGKMDSKSPTFSEAIIDDGLSTITADEYVKLRLIPLIASFTSKAPGFAQTTNTVNIIIIALSIVSSVLSVFDYSVFIPIAMAFSGALSSWISFRQTDLRLMKTNTFLLRR